MILQTLFAKKAVYGSVAALLYGGGGTGLAWWALGLGGIPQAKLSSIELERDSLEITDDPTRESRKGIVEDIELDDNRSVSLGIKPVSEPTRDPEFPPTESKPELAPEVPQEQKVKPVPVSAKPEPTVENTPTIEEVKEEKPEVQQESAPVTLPLEEKAEQVTVITVEPEKASEETEPVVTTAPEEIQTEEDAPAATPEPKVTEDTAPAVAPAPEDNKDNLVVVSAEEVTENVGINTVEPEETPELSVVTEKPETQPEVQKQEIVTQPEPIETAQEEALPKAVSVEPEADIKEVVPPAPAPAPKAVETPKPKTRRNLIVKGQNKVKTEIVNGQFKIEPDYTKVAGTNLPAKFVESQIYKLESSSGIEGNDGNIYCTAVPFNVKSKQVTWTEINKRKGVNGNVESSGIRHWGGYSCVNVAWHKEYYGNEGKWRGAWKLIYSYKSGIYGSILVNIVTADEGKYKVEGTSYALFKNDDNVWQVSGWAKTESKELNSNEINKFVILPGSALEKQENNWGFNFSDQNNICGKEECTEDIEITKTDYSFRVWSYEQNKDKASDSFQELSSNFSSWTAKDGLFPEYENEFYKKQKFNMKLMVDWNPTNDTKDLQTIKSLA